MSGGGVATSAPNEGGSSIALVTLYGVQTIAIAARVTGFSPFSREGCNSSNKLTLTRVCSRGKQRMKTTQKPLVSPLLQRQQVRRPLALAVSAACGVVGSMSISAPALSQSLEEVLVTATRRAESVQDIPDECIGAR